MLAEIKYFVNWVRRRNPEARTWKDYRYDLEQFVSVVGDRPPKDITIQDIDNFIMQQVSRGMQPGESHQGRIPDGGDDVVDRAAVDGSSEVSDAHGPTVVANARAWMLGGPSARHDQAAAGSVPRQPALATAKRLNERVPISDTSLRKTKKRCSG